MYAFSRNDCCCVETNVVQRYITLKPAVAFGLTILSSWEGIGLTIGAALLNGGPTVLIYGTIASALGTLAIAASLGELASMYAPSEACLKGVSI